MEGENLQVSEYYADSYIWEAPEYHHREKTKDWFWGLGIVTTTIVVISFILGNYYFGIFLALAAFTLAIFAHRPPRMVEVEIGPRGIRLDKTLYYYSELDSFWVREQDLHPKILVKSRKLFMTYIIVPLGDIDPEDVRDYLLNYLKEEVHQEPFFQRLLEYLGF